MGRDSTYSGGREPIKIFLSSLLQTGFPAGPAPGKDLSFYNLPSLGIVIENLWNPVRHPTVPPQKI